MDIITKQKTYFWLISALAVLNLVILFLLWNGRHNDMPPRGMKEERQERGFAPPILNLSSEKKLAFDKYSSEYFNTRDSITQLINAKKKEMYEEVFKKDSDKSKADKLAEEIGILNAGMEKAFFKHFTNLKGILNDGQLRAFQKKIAETINPHIRDRRQDPKEEPRPF